MKKLGQLFAGIAIITAGIGITILSKERKEVLVLEEDIEADAKFTPPVMEE